MVVRFLEDLKSRKVRSQLLIVRRFRVCKLLGYCSDGPRVFPEEEGSRHLQGHLEDHWSQHVDLEIHQEQQVLIHSPQVAVILT